MDGDRWTDGRTNKFKLDNLDDIPFPLTTPVWFRVAFCSFHSHLFTKFAVP